MVTLTDVIRLAISEVTKSLTKGDNAYDWKSCYEMEGRLATRASMLEKEYGDFNLTVKLALSSYFLSFLVLFFQKKGPAKTADMLAVKQLEEPLAFLAATLTTEDHHYRTAVSAAQAPLSPRDFLNRWLTTTAPFSARNAKENIILDLLIRFDQQNQTRLSSRIMYDISYLIHSLAMEDDKLCYSEKVLLEFLDQETAKIKAAIGDDSVFDPLKYADLLDQKDAEQLLAEAKEELNELIGLEGIKHEIKRLEAFLRIRKLRESVNLAVTDVTLHFVFKGNPGTGKTTVARILGKLFKGLGFLKKGHLEETDRSGLVAEYLGQTAVKTKAKAETARDGILFIDEAYALSRNVGSGSDNFGREAIETILKFMEDNRRSLVVIVAGYPKLMDDFIESNPGLKSRFTRYLTFADFSPHELCRIMQLFASKAQYCFSSDALPPLCHILSCGFEQRREGFGNARFVRNLFEETVQNQAMRLTSAEEQPSKDVLMVLETDDLPKTLDGVSFSLKDAPEKAPWCIDCDNRQKSCPTEEEEKQQDVEIDERKTIK